MGMYHKLGYHPKYQQPMYHALKFKPYKFETRAPKTLFPPNMENSPRNLVAQRRTQFRPSSAGRVYVCDKYNVEGWAQCFEYSNPNQAFIVRIRV